MATIDPETMDIKTDNETKLAEEMSGSAYGELMQQIVTYDENGNLYIAAFSTENGEELGKILRINAGESDFDPAYNAFPDPEGKIHTIQYLGAGKALVYARVNSLGTKTDSHSRYYAVVDLNTGRRTRLACDGTELPYCSGGFSQRSAIADGKAYIGVTPENAAPSIYIYDIVSGTTTKGGGYRQGILFRHATCHRELKYIAARQPLQIQTNKHGTQTLNAFQKIRSNLRAPARAIPGHAEASGKDKGILMVHYGTTNDDMRARSLEAINADVKSAFPTHEFIEAYTSPAVITALEKKGLSYPTLTEALMTLRGKGITDVVVQSTMLMNGGQTDFVNRECERMRVFYNEMNVGRPLLYTIEDSRFLANALSRKYAGKASGRHDAVVFVGHGETTRARQYTVNSAICCLRRREFLCLNNRGISGDRQSHDCPEAFESEKRDPCTTSYSRRQPYPERHRRNLERAS